MFMGAKAADQVVTPTGRAIWGHLGTPKKKGDASVLVGQGSEPPSHKELCSTKLSP